VLARITSICTLLLLYVMPAVHADKTAADYFVSSLPGAPEGPLLKMHAGYADAISLNRNDLILW
jgi:carboxypeptidase D